MSNALDSSLQRFLAGGWLALTLMDDAHPDRFYQMDKQMRVFGFGRQGLNKFLGAGSTWRG